jgi:hypothetical protein
MDFMPARASYVAADADPTTAASMKTDATAIDTMILDLLAMFSPPENIGVVFREEILKIVPLSWQLEP